MNRKTYQPKHRDISRDWHLIDAEKKVLGRLSSEITNLLMGKNKVNYAPHMDMGDFVVIINAEKIVVTGKKEANKVYYRHSGYPGGFKEIKYSKLKKEQPEKIIQLAIKRMLPDNRLRDKRMSRLKVFSGEKHTFKDKFTKKK